MVSLTDSGFDLDLGSVEEEMEWDDEQSFDPVEEYGADRVVLAILDGTTPPEAWVEEIESGHVLVLSVEGDLNELAAGFARDVKAVGGQLMHFRSFLVVTPAGVDIDNDRL